MLKRLGWLCTALVALCFGAAAQDAKPLPLQMWAERDTAFAEKIALPLEPTDLDGEQWLFLPAFADAQSMGLIWQADDVPSEADDLEQETIDTQGVRRALLPDGTEANVMQSQNLRALFLLSADPVNQGRAFIENCSRHENETTGSMVLVDAEGHISHADSLRQLRGRGNGSWSYEKLSYQFKLENRADLLNTGDSQEAARTWVLLAEQDRRKLNNKIALDLGLELGIENTSHNEWVDLYYDGEYRGLYLLAEKVEIDPARIDETDFDKLLEDWNRRVGNAPLETLPVGEGQNRFGCMYTYIQNVEDSGRLDAGAYLVEMESDVTLSERCFFTLPDGGLYDLKNPENPSDAMMRYISERLSEAWETAANGGIHPTNGRTLADDFDIDAFVRVALINELASNLDGFCYSSSWFVLPAGESRFQPGPPWDFDLAWRYPKIYTNAGSRRMKDESGWLPAFYGCEAFVQRASEVFKNEVYPLVQNVLLGEEKGHYLQSISAYEQWINASSRMDNRLWGMYPTDSRLLYGKNERDDVRLLRQFLDERSRWLLEAFQQYGKPDQTWLWYGGVYAHVGEQTVLASMPWDVCTVDSVSEEQLTEATEDEYALWQVQMVLRPEVVLDEPIVFVNGVRLPAQEQQDGTWLVTFTFRDPSYRPVDYYGEDIGLVYNYDVYIQNHPEVLDICGDDPEAVMEYFCDEGMYEGHMGNAFFEPRDLMLHLYTLRDSIGEDPEPYYWEYIAYGHEYEKWTLHAPHYFYPDVQPIP